jgi:alkanesulfonate monooxygenase SsuD/methylene tetrahydromethanopterin reductase-like flavin-dependent oxidoreductase (luciferase family)
MGERRTLPLVARFADVWNVPTYGLDRWEAAAAVLDEACAAIGRDPASLARSHQAVLVLAADDAALATALERAERRYAGPGWNLAAGGYVGTPPALVDHLASMRERGVDRFILLPADRGEGHMLELLATEVLPHLR